MIGKAMTLRLGLEESEALDAISEIEGRPVAEIVRLAILEAIEQRRADPGFQQRLRDSVDRHGRMIDRMRPASRSVRPPSTGRGERGRGAGPRSSDGRDGGA
jgi:hypothetical protein